MAKQIKRKTGWAYSQRELAGAHGVSVTLIGHWLADLRWREAKFSRHSPWSKEEIEKQKQWRAETLNPDRTRGDAEGGGGLSKAKMAMQVKVLVERELNLRVDRLIKEKEYVKRADADESMADKLRALRLAAMQVPRALRQVVADEVDAGKCEEILTNALRVIFVEGTI